MTNEKVVGQSSEQVSLEKVKQAANLKAREQQELGLISPEDDTSDWGSYAIDLVLEEFGIPIILAWDWGDYIPLEIMKQMIGQSFGVGMKIHVNGIDCIVVGIDNSCYSPGETIFKTPEITQIGWLELAEARHFVL